MLFDDQDSDEEIDLICDDNLDNPKDDFNLDNIDESQSIDIDANGESTPAKSYDDFPLNLEHNKTANSSKII